MSQIEISGIVKIPARQITLEPASFLNAEELAAEHELLPLPVSNLHVTLLHQSVGGLKALCKEIKKTKQDPVAPSVPLPSIDTEGAEVVMVKDTHPKTSEQRTTVRIVLRKELQSALSAWVADFCELNGLERDGLEMRRVYHISYANRTGLSGDSVR